MYRQECHAGGWMDPGGAGFLRRAHMLHSQARALSRTRQHRGEAEHIYLVPTAEGQHAALLFKAKQNYSSRGKKNLKHPRVM